MIFLLLSLLSHYYIICNIVLSPSFVLVSATVQITGPDIVDITDISISNSVVSSLEVDATQAAASLLVDPTKMCRHTSRGRFHDSMNIIVPSSSGGGGGGGPRSLLLDTNIHTLPHLNDGGSNSLNARRRNYNNHNNNNNNNNNNYVSTSKRHRRKVNTYCVKEAEVMREAMFGAKLATDECQHQFKHRHWNCSSHPKSIKRILAKDTRETAFIHAIISAGVTFAVTQGCSSGKIQNCPCDRTLSGTKSKDGNWEWGGCGDNINIGYKRSKDILDIKIRRQSDIRSLMMLHNNEAGRLAVRNHMRLVCKCHGLSGSCTLKTCWQKVPTFREIGERLKIRFDGSSKVISGNDGKSIIPAVKSIKPPVREDLIYFEDSVDFCQSNKKTGSLGTAGRVCNMSSMNVDSCDILCCSRGHFARVVRVKEYCRCKFQWCCEVSCEVCTMRKLVTTCR